jgi:hypothetical protein
MRTLMAFACLFAQVPALPVAPPPVVMKEAPTVPVSLVYQTVGSPVVVEATRSAEGRVHARVRLKNVSNRTVAAVTVAITVGDGSSGPLRRYSETIPVSLPPGATSDLTVHGPPTEVLAALLEGSRAGVAELGVMEAVFGTGATWVSPQPVGWLKGDSERRGIECVDGAGRTSAVGERLVESAVARECRADGVRVRR